MIRLKFLRNFSFLFIAAILISVSSAPSYAQSSRTVPAEITQHINDMQKMGVRPRIVLFWASIGMGHFVAAQSIKNDINALFPDAEVELVDVRDFQNPVLRKFVSKWYDLATKNLPALYDAGWKKYIQETAELSSPGDSTVAKHHHPDLVEMYLQEVKPTMIFSAFNHATEVLINLRDQGELLDIPIAQVLTDFTAVKYFEKLGERVDMTFVPHEGIRQEFIGMGLPEDKVITSGMPVSPLAYTTMSFEERHAFLTKEGLSPDVNTVLLMGGSAGVGNFQSMVRSMAEESNGMPLQIVAVCGRNETQVAKLNKLQTWLQQKYKNVTLQVNGFIKQPELFNYMKSVNLIVTKSGGLTSAELAVVGTPTILLDINGGQEFFNADFFAKQGMAVKTNDQSAVGALVQEVLKNKVLQQSMIQAQGEMKDSNDPAAIARWAVSQQHKPLGQPWENPPSFGEKPQLTMADARPGFNKALLLWDESEVWDMRWSFIRSEKEEIFASYFLWDMKKIGMLALSGLWNQARQGAKVRLLLDGYPPTKWDDTKIDPAIVKALADAGVEVRLFNSPSITDVGSLKRDHDKLMYFGSQKVAITGDRNMQNINFRMQKTNDKKGLSYRSVEVAVQGNAARDVKAYLEDVWAVSQTVNTAGVTPEQTATANRNLARYFAVDSQPKEDSRQHWLNEMMPVKDVRFLHDEVGRKGVIQYPKRQLLPLIAGAKDFVRLTTPYPRPIPEYEEALKTAHGNGAKTYIQTASIGSTDNQISTVAFGTMVDRLRSEGMEIRQHNGPDFLHAKMLEIDHKYTYVTSDNFNARSAYNDLESGFLIEDEGFARRAAQFQVEITPESGEFIKETGPMRTCQGLLMRMADKIPIIKRQF